MSNQIWGVQSLSWICEAPGDWTKSSYMCYGYLLLSYSDDRMAPCIAFIFFCSSMWTCSCLWGHVQIISVCALYCSLMTKLFMLMFKLFYLSSMVIVLWWPDRSICIVPVLFTARISDDHSDTNVHKCCWFRPVYLVCEIYVLFSRLNEFMNLRHVLKELNIICPWDVRVCTPEVFLRYE
jgi:hypothetical protein